MKKLLMAAAIVCAAALSQAATVNWGISGVKNSAGTAPTAGWAVMAFYTEVGAGSDAIVSAIQSKTAGSLAFDTQSLKVSFGSGKYGPADVAAAQASTADYVLLDSGAGGTGTCFDWSLLQDIQRPYFLAGGLTPENVGGAVATLHPYAVDVSSGIETDGRKDADKMEAFMRTVRRERA